MIIAYDGTGYAGWIQQKNQPSIVQTLTNAFFHVFKKKIVILGASKTDAGVHAMGQVAVFKSDLPLDTHTMQRVWNKALPQAIVIRSLRADATFHPHYEVSKKTYYYHLFFERPLPFYARYGTYIPYPIDLTTFKIALQLFQGTHNFAAFYSGNNRSDTQRTINDIRIVYLKQYNAYRIIIVGTTFLHHMIRRIIGASLAAASNGPITYDVIQTALETGTMHHGLPTAPAQGLMLYAITYKHESLQ